MFDRPAQEKDGFLAGRPLIVHGFSIGAFVWGLLMIELAKADDGDEDTDDRGRDRSGDSSVTSGTATATATATANGDSNNIHAPPARGDTEAGDGSDRAATDDAGEFFVCFIA